jgi:hypothetical protein
VPKWRRISLAMLALLNLVTLLLRCTAAFFRRHTEQAIVELTLRQPLKRDPARTRLNWWPREWQAKWCSLDEKERYVESTYRNIAYFAAMPGSRLNAVGELVRHLCDAFAIPRRIPGARRRAAFDAPFFAKWSGVAAHQNFRKEKWDVGPAFDWDHLDFQVSI